MNKKMHFLRMPESEEKRAQEWDSYIASEAFIKDYVTLGQTYSQLAEKYGCSAVTIQRKIDQYRMVVAVHTTRRVVAVMDTTCWGADSSYPIEVLGCAPEVIFGQK